MPNFADRKFVKNEQFVPEVQAAVQGAVRGDQDRWIKGTGCPCSNLYRVVRSSQLVLIMSTRSTRFFGLNLYI